MSEHGLTQLPSVAEVIRLIDAVPVRPRAVRSARRDVPRSSAPVLSRPIVADRDYPPFNKSLVDGYAVCSADLSAAPATLKLAGEIAAGAAQAVAFPHGSCVAIMTGAPVPTDADAVVPIEETQSNGAGITFSRAAKRGQSISRQGSDLRAGELVLPAGVPIGPAQVGAIVQVGAFDLIPKSLFDIDSQVDSNSAVRAHLLVTGDEIVSESDTPNDRQMRDVNGPLLATLLTSMQVRTTRSRIIDDPIQTREAIDRHARENDLLLVTGGMSMGKYDYVPRALVELGFDLRVTKLRIKPGKPFVFAVRERAEKTDFVFGLPGNPVSGFCCTLRFVSRLIDRLHGESPIDTLNTATLDAPLKANGPREFYQPAIVNGSIVTPLGWKGSADVFTLAKANALIVRPMDDAERRAGESVSVLPFERR